MIKKSDCFGGTSLIDFCTYSLNVLHLIAIWVTSDPFVDLLRREIHCPEFRHVFCSLQPRDKKGVWPEKIKCIHRNYDMNLLSKRNLETSILKQITGQ